MQISIHLLLQANYELARQILTSAHGDSVSAARILQLMQTFPGLTPKAAGAAIDAAKKSSAVIVWRASLPSSPPAQWTNGDWKAWKGQSTGLLRDYASAVGGVGDPYFAQATVEKFIAVYSKQVFESNGRTVVFAHSAGAELLPAVQLNLARGSVPVQRVFVHGVNSGADTKGWAKVAGAQPTSEPLSQILDGGPRSVTLVGGGTYTTSDPANFGGTFPDVLSRLGDSSIGMTVVLHKSIRAAAEGNSAPLMRLLNDPRVLHVDGQAVKATMPMTDLAPRASLLPIKKSIEQADVSWYLIPGAQTAIGMTSAEGGGYHMFTVMPFWGAQPGGGMRDVLFGQGPLSLEGTNDAKQRVQNKNVADPVTPSDIDVSGGTLVPRRVGLGPTFTPGGGLNSPAFVAAWMPIGTVQRDNQGRIHSFRSTFLLDDTPGRSDTGANPEQPGANASALPRAVLTLPDGAKGIAIDGFGHSSLPPSVLARFSGPQSSMRLIFSNGQGLRTTVGKSANGAPLVVQQVYGLADTAYLPDGAQTLPGGKAGGMEVLKATRLANALYSNGMPAPQIQAAISDRFAALGVIPEKAAELARSLTPHRAVRLSQADVVVLQQRLQRSSTPVQIDLYAQEDGSFVATLRGGAPTPETGRLELKQMIDLVESYVKAAAVGAVELDRAKKDLQDARNRLNSSATEDDRNVALQDINQAVDVLGSPDQARKLVEQLEAIDPFWGFATAKDLPVHPIPWTLEVYRNPYAIEAGKRQ